MWEYLVPGSLALALVLHWLFEIQYFLRAALTVFLARFCKKKIPITDSTTFTGVCTTSDVDFLLFHMNNSRYLRELDFARLDFYERTGLLAAILGRGGSVFQGATSIRYRRFIRPFSLYTITSKIIYWDSDSIYMEHQYKTWKDSFVRAVVLCKQRLVGVAAEEVLGALARGGIKPDPPSPDPPPPPRPDPPPHLAAWIQSNTISSDLLRNIV